MPENQNNVGQEITNSEASAQFSLFEEAKGEGFPSPYNFPSAVCYTISELKDFLDAADNSLPSTIPEANRGIAFMLGINSSEDAGHPQNQISVMLVATAFEANSDRQVTSLSNTVLGDQGMGEVSGKNYNSGNTFP